MKFSFIITLVFFLTQFVGISQFGEDGGVTIAAPSIVNEYTYLTSDATASSTTLSVNSSTLNDNGRFSNSLQGGDLILIIQHQGATLNTNGTPQDWGAIVNYNNAGNYEYCEVSNVPNSNSIQLRCGLTKSYTASGQVQIVRIPRYNDLTINSNLTADAWDGQTGGIIALECQNNLILNASGTIDANEIGFRGGIEDYAATGSGSWNVALTNTDGGGLKGESIFGYDTDYNTIGGKYGYGAPANGGGGGNSHNGGGGGGANAGDVNNWQNGVGVPSPTYNTAWALESPPINGIIATGGGKGGYTFSSNNSNPNTNGPNDYGAWGGDGRRPLGGLGGRPLDYSTGKIFFGGGGGSGDVNDQQTLGGHGGNSGGIVFIECKGTISGTGTINANGADGIDAYTTNPPTTSFAGNDGAGGGGAGGTVIINSANPLSNLNVNAQGGNGGNQVLDGGTFYFGSLNEAEGPGGGGSGGYISFSSGTINASLIGGTNGVTNSNSLTSFPPNGATSGGTGVSSINPQSNFTLTGVNDTICAGNAATVSVVVNGTLPSGSSLIWYDAPTNGNFIGAGSSYSTSNVSSNTTFYVGVCPGTYTIPVSVIMGTSFTYSDVNVTIQEENCGQSDGSITGFTVTGGAQPLQYEWNGILTASADLTNAEAGNYTLVITDNNGCAATIGTYVLGENTGPTIDDSGLLSEDDHCNQGIGSINGLVGSGNAPLIYSWNSVVSTIDIDNLNAGDYDLSIEDSFGCISNYSTISIQNIGGPVIDTTNMIITNATCGIINGEINGITVINPSNSTIDIVWYNSNETTMDISNLGQGEYSIVVNDAFGCFDSIGPITVNAIGNPTADFSFSANPVLVNDSVYYTNESSLDVTNYYFTLSDGNTTSNQNGVEIFNQIGVHEICINVENSAGCIDSICKSLTVEENIEVIIPNVITPNGDGENDTFIIQGIENFSLSIFNRWGQEIYFEKNYLNNWEGRNKSGEKVSDGTYYYVISPNTDEEIDFSGYFQLSR